MFCRTTFSYALALVVCSTVGATVIAYSTASARSISPRMPTTRCAKAIPTGSPKNPWPAAEHQLAPPGATAIRLCGYFDTPTQGRARPTRDARPAIHWRRTATLLTGSTVTRLTRRYDALGATPRDARKPFTTCFADQSAVLAQFVYPTVDHPLTIFMPINSCPSATNGDITRAYPRPDLRKLRSMLISLSSQPAASRSAAQAGSTLGLATEGAR